MWKEGENWRKKQTNKKNHHFSKANAVINLEGNHQWVLPNIRWGLSWWHSGVQSASLVQGTRVWSLVQEDPHAFGAAETVHQNYWAHALGTYEPQLVSPHAAATGAREP